jgi:phenylacetate-CoA oxygenase PaaH subunit
MSTYEVFLKPAGRDGFAHVGALDAPDDDFALVLARETYVRRGEGELAWVVRRSNVLVLDPDDLAVTANRAHSINDGHVVADRRKDRRTSAKQTAPNHGSPEEPITDQTGLKQAGPNQAGPNQAGPNQAGSNQMEASS